MHKNWMVLMATAAVIGTLQVGGALAQEPQTGGALRILATGEPDHMDPALAGMVPTNNLMRAISRQLVSYESSSDPDVALKPVGDLATEVPQPTDGGLTYTFTLRDGAMFNAPSGPRQITSADVERGFKRLCNPHMQAATLTYFTALISGLSEFCDGFAKVEPTAAAMKAYIEGNDVTGIETPDEKTVVFKLKERAGDFVYMLSLPMPAPAAIETLDYIPDSPEFRANFIGSGPYTIGEYTPDTSLKLVRNPAWKAESDPLRKAYVDEIDITMGMQADAIMQQLQSGDGDLAYDINVPTAILSTLAATGDEKLTAMSSGNTNFLFINTVSENNKGALKDLRVRQALQYAVDKAAIVQQWGGSTVAEPANGIFGIGVLGYHKFDLYPSTDAKGDPEKAKALLKEAGFPDGITLKMPYRNKDLEVATAATIQASLARAGITLEMTPVTAADYYSKFMTNPVNTKEGTWDIAPVGWTPDWVGGAARSVFQPQFTFNGTHQTYNYTDYNNPKANEIAAKAINATTPEETAKLWAEVDELVMADAPVVPLIANKNPRYRSEAVKNYQPYALGVEGDWTNLWLER
ncbi:MULTISPECIES: ABC transporter substrate-binding protein [unclassified Rhizobium]|uniref:ABC transporter substrate-binding protein n=1 Tax=unclassified Rhizobium TaxID=2613769 RepID=UPI000A675324|nr:MULTISPECIES: ABC transporter substrate-binding protein [unclassified Rhizobium]